MTEQNLEQIASKPTLRQKVTAGILALALLAEMGIAGCAGSYKKAHIDHNKMDYKETNTQTTNSQLSRLNQQNTTNATIQTQAQITYKKIIESVLIDTICVNDGGKYLPVSVEEITRCRDALIDDYNISEGNCFIPYGDMIEKLKDGTEVKKIIDENCFIPYENMIEKFKDCTEVKKIIDEVSKPDYDGKYCGFSLEKVIYRLERTIDMNLAIENNNYSDALAIFQYKWDEMPVKKAKEIAIKIISGCNIDYVDHNEIYYENIYDILNSLDKNDLEIIFKNIDDSFQSIDMATYEKNSKSSVFLALGKGFFYWNNDVLRNKCLEKAGVSSREIAEIESYYSSYLHNSAKELFYLEKERKEYDEHPDRPEYNAHNQTARLWARYAEEQNSAAKYDKEKIRSWWMNKMHSKSVHLPEIIAPDIIQTEEYKLKNQEFKKVIK